MRSLRLPPLLLGLLVARTPPLDPAEHDTYIRLCTAWDAAYRHLQETGDTLALDPAIVQEAEAICGSRVRE